MTPVFFPIADPATAMAVVSPSFPLPMPTAPPACRFAGEPVRWVSVGAAVALSAFARSVMRVYPNQTGLPGAPGAMGTLVELSPLPAGAFDVFKAIPGGLPVLYLLVPDAVADLPGRDNSFIRGGQVVLTTATASRGWFGLCFQDRMVRDPATWAAELRAAVDAAHADVGSWRAFAERLAAIVDRHFFVLDHVGRPLTAGQVSISIGGGQPQAVSFGNAPNQARDGDTGVPVAGGASVTVAFTSATEPIVASVERPNGSVAAALALPADERHAQVLDADSWFALRPADVMGLDRWHRNNMVEPILDGTPYFRRLVVDLRAAKNGGGIHLAGWAFIKDSVLDKTQEWPLVPEDETTRLVPLTRELVTGGAKMRFLVNQFLQVPPGGLDDVEAAQLILFGLFAALIPAQALGALTTDAGGFGVLVGGMALGTPTFTANRLRDLVEYSKSTVDALKALPQVDDSVIIWTPYPPTTDDNPLATFPIRVIGVTVDDINHFGVYHHKIAVIRRADGTYVSYLGGIDINSDRVDTPLHRSLLPFHDVQARLTGPAIRDVAKTVEDRLLLYRPADPPPTAFATPDRVPDAGTHFVQIGRTYYAPNPPRPAVFGFAPHGEQTIHDTLLRAIGQARDFIYVEDQYFTPSYSYVQALLDAADPARDVRALVITVPTETDQLYGSFRRSDVFAALQSRWNGRLHFGAPLRRYAIPTPEVYTNLGRCALRGSIDSVVSQIALGPLAHVPDPPFWVFVEGELMYCSSLASGHVQDGRLLQVERGPVGPNQRWGASPGGHGDGSPATCVRVPGVYVHAKVMIVDDIFVSIGTANINRRGLFHDGEINCFAVPQQLKRDPANPARLLRCQLWAEHLGLPPEIGLSLLADPISALGYFTRSWYAGCRWQLLSWFGSPPPAVDLGTSIIKVAAGAALEVYKPILWPTAVDPTCVSDPNADANHKGPELAPELH